VFLVAVLALVGILAARYGDFRPLDRSAMTPAGAPAMASPAAAVVEQPVGLSANEASEAEEPTWVGFGPLDPNDVGVIGGGPASDYSKDVKCTPDNRYCDEPPVLAGGD
jgi:hypothetical protein